MTVAKVDRQLESCSCSTLNGKYTKPLAKCYSFSSEDSALFMVAILLAFIFYSINPIYTPLFILFVYILPLHFPAYLFIFGFQRATLCTTEPYFQHQSNHCKSGMESSGRQRGKK